jgi:hypothetical protein
MAKGKKSPFERLSSSQMNRKDRESGAAPGWQ